MERYVRGLCLDFRINELVKLNAATADEMNTTYTTFANTEAAPYLEF